MPRRMRALDLRASTCDPQRDATPVSNSGVRMRRSEERNWEAGAIPAQSRYCDGEVRFANATRATGEGAKRTLAKRLNP